MVYRATRRDKKYLKLFKQGKSIGFTITASLKAKGLIPRANGTRRVSKKYRRGGGVLWGSKELGDECDSGSRGQCGFSLVCKRDASRNEHNGLFHWSCQH